MLNWLESFLKKHMAGLFHRGFSNELEPAELREEIEEEAYRLNSVYSDETDEMI